MAQAFNNKSYYLLSVAFLVSHPSSFDVLRHFIVPSLTWYPYLDTGIENPLLSCQHVNVKSQMSFPKTPRRKSADVVERTQSFTLDSSSSQHQSLVHSCLHGLSNNLSASPAICA